MYVALRAQVSGKGTRSTKARCSLFFAIPVVQLCLRCTSDTEELLTIIREFEVVNLRDAS